MLFNWVAFRSVPISHSDRSSMSWRFHGTNPWSWFALCEESQKAPILPDALFSTYIPGVVGCLVCLTAVRSKSLSSNNISKVEAAQTMFSCPLGKAVSLVSSFGSVGVGYSSSLGHFLITAVSNPYIYTGWLVFMQKRQGLDFHSYHKDG